ncbi:WecB/TagA/CpsF family glycosyltransferase [Gordonia sp. NPDC127522]|uniref:WecB/TagA/CpsF family glycosyltransferase n=1 Tax=Gordonia sp. NPDC127522 TaxID=3345390 RepID=UPI00363BE677
MTGRSQEFAGAMASADIIHADGMPVVIASRFARYRLPERIATTDFFHDAAAAGQEAGLRFFFLGGTDDQNSRAVAEVRRRYPRLQIAGRHHGYFKDADAEQICADVRAADTDVLWIALGKPRQEYWSLQFREKLQGVGWVKTCGGLYAFLAGDVSRAPGWMQASGLEWLYRMIEDPKRLGKRYATTNPYSAYRILRFTDWRFNAVRSKSSSIAKKEQI